MKVTIRLTVSLLPRSPESKLGGWAAAGSQRVGQRDVHETGLGQGKAWGQVNMCHWPYQWVPNPKASNKTRMCS